jgi:UDP-N-acetyl-D-mannosaminuronic acid dehydrogenase
LNFKKICVIGLGYIGLPTASTFATHGIQVIGVDVNQRVVQTLQNGEIHIHEPGLRTLVQAAIKSGNLSISDHPEEADAFIIAVPTPFKGASQKSQASSVKREAASEQQTRATDYPLADLSYVTAAAEAIVPVLRSGNLVILESTSPPRTTEDIVAPILEKSGLTTGIDFHLAYSPERVLPGQILRELIENARVIGGITPASAQAGHDLYATFVRGEIIQTTATTAEMVKLMENTTRDVNIAIANEFSRLAARFGVDVWEAIQLANLHPRINILRPGPGVGGHCISVDPWFFVEAAPDLTPLIHTARNVNDAQPAYVVELIRQAVGALKGIRIAVLGLAYKPNVDDLRESPAIEVARLLIEAGADVITYEPFKVDSQIPGIPAAPSLEAALAGSDLLVLLVAHTPIKNLTPTEVTALTEARVVVDTVNLWSPEVWEPAGFTIRRLGVGYQTQNDE